MNTNHSFGTRVLAFILSIIMVMGMIPGVPVVAEESYEAQIGDELYETLAEALAAVPVGTDQETTITLLKEVTHSFDVGTEDGSAPQRIVLDLGGYILNLRPAVGSVGTKSSGIRVLANSKLTLKNGQIKCSDAEADNIKVGIANYGTLELNSVVLTAGSQTIYSVNNRGRLILSGSTKIENGTGANFQFGITNDPYNYIYENVDAVVECNSPAVEVKKMQIERYARETTNAGGIVLNITAGNFGSIVEDGGTSVDVKYNISGGTIGAATSKELETALKIVSDGATIQLKDNVTLGFDVGVENGSVSKNIVLDLNGKTLTTAPAVGSAGTETNGIRVLANSALTLKNGTVASPDATDDVTVKVGIANYGILNLSNITMQAGNAVIYTINNRGALTLSGKTTVNDGTVDGAVAITNDPYEYVYSNTDAVLNVSDSNVIVGKVLVERYQRNTTNAGGVVLNISAGTFGSVNDDGGVFVNMTPGITGGIFGNDVSTFVKEGYECVQQENGSYKIQFIKLEQDQLVFEQANPEPLTYTENCTFSNPVVSGGTTGGKITYELVIGDSVTVNADTGVVTVVKAGTSTIRATMEGNDVYSPVSAEYELTVERADRKVNFANASNRVYYGTASLKCPELVIEKGAGEVFYQVIDGDGIAEVDANGVLTFKDCAMGTVTVRATIAADDCYNSCTADYTVTVEPLPKPDVPYQVEGQQGENGWFKSAMTISAPGYTMSKTNSMDGEWVEKITYTDEGDYEEIIYLKNEDGFITDQVTVYVKIDEQAPSELNIKYSNYSWIDEFKAMLGSSEKVDVTFSFVETGSGPAKVEFSLDDGMTYESAVYADGVYSTSVAPQYRGYVRFRVTDAAGWVTEREADGTLVVVDKKAPGITLSYVGEYDEETDENGLTIITTSEEAFQIIYTVTDENLDLQEADPTLSITDKNNEPLQMDVIWTDVEVDGMLGKQAILVLSAENIYNILLSCSDRTNTVELSMQVIVDRTPPELEVVKDSEPVRTVDGKSYYGAGEAKVAANVRKENFDSSRADIEIKYGDTIINSSEYGSYGISVPYRWTENGESTNSKVITFGENAPEGTYTVQLSYVTGQGRNRTTVYSEPFVLVLDKSNPTISVSYQENEKDLFSSIINGLGFSYANEKVDVTIKATDSVSGIHHLVYKIDNETECIVTNDQMKEDNTYTFTIEKEYRDMVYAKAVDMVDRSVEATGHNTVIIDRQEATFGVTGMGSKGEATATQREDGVKVYTTGDDQFELIFEVTQQNFDASVTAPAIQYRRENVGMWVAVGENYLTRTDLTDADGKVVGTRIQIKMPEDVVAANGTGDYEFRCTYSLFDGWQYSTSEMAVVHFDADPPVITTIYNTDANKNPDKESKVMFFYEDQAVTIRVKEKNFSEDNVSIKVMRKAAKNSINEEDYTAQAIGDGKWLHQLNNNHELTLNIADEGYYTLEVQCTDTVETSAAQNIADQFVIDKNDPTDLMITYQEEIEWEWIEALQNFFAFFNLKGEDEETTEKITVTLSAKDEVSGINSILVSVDGREFEQAELKNGNYTFSVEEGFRGQLTIKAVDGAMREATMMEQGAIVVDSIDPVIEAEYDANHHAYNETLYTNSDSFRIGFVVSDANYDLRAENAVIKVGDVVQELTWSDGQVAGMPSGTTELFLKNEGTHTVNAVFGDRSGNKTVWSKNVVVDRTAPAIDVVFEDGKDQYPGDDTYYQSAQTVKITITESSFLPELVELVVTGGEENNYTEYAHELQNWTTEGDQHTLIIVIENDGKYTLDLNCTDLAGNSAGYDAEFTVDKTDPELQKISYNKAAWATILENVTLGFFKAPVTVTITASDDTAGIKSISYAAVGTEGVQSDVEVKLEGTDVPDENGNISFEIAQAFYGTITAWAVDNANNESVKANVGYDENENELQEIVVDAIRTNRTVNLYPVRIVAIDGMTDCTGFEEGDEKVLYFQDTALIDIVLEEDNFFPENYQVMINGEGRTVSWTSTGTQHSCRVQIVGDGDYELVVTGKDYSGNEMDMYVSQRIVLDSAPPVVDVTYTMMVDEEIVDVTETITDGQETVPAMDGPVTAHVTIAEHNFRSQDVKVLVTVDGDVLELDENGYVKYYLEQGCTQNAENEDAAGKWSAFESGTWRRNDDKYEIDLSFNADETYTLQVVCEDLSKNTNATEKTSFIVDNKDPVIIVTGVKDGEYYSDVKTVTFVIQERNFDPSAVEFSYSATSSNGTTVELPDLTLGNNWTPNEDMTEWTMELELSNEANYTLSLKYTDPSGRTGKVFGTDNVETYMCSFTIDWTKPYGLSISYNECVAELDSVKYYADNMVMVTLEAIDDTAGMMSFEIKLDGDSRYAAATNGFLPSDALIIRYDENLAVLNERLLAGNMAFQVYGNAGKPLYEDGKMKVTVAFHPEFRGDISFRAVDLAGQYEDKADNTLIAVDSLKPVLNVELPDTGRVEDGKLYYKAKRVTAKLIMSEANFYDDDPVFKVNGQVTELSWKHDAVNQIHTAEYTMNGEGTYRLTMEYVDRSGNAMVAYASEDIILDQTAPVIKVSYDRNDPVSTYDGREYYNQTRIATIEVTEHNFVGEDVDIQVKAVDINGKTVQAPIKSAWTTNGDVHTMYITYGANAEADANYTFDVEYTDRAGNVAADYPEDLFTVDQTDPSTVKISYSKSVLDSVLDAISFYDAKVTVYLENQDVTAGTQEFVYSYIKASGVSNVNSGKTDLRVTATRNGDKATASFQIPQSELVNGTQFNGTVTVTAIDRSGNWTITADDERIVVDNISPTATITYNDPVQNVDGTAYYSDSITARIRVNEANFYKNDVSVSVKRDGVEYPVKPVWSDDSVDVHTGTFTLAQEGDYIVSVTYRDKSGNAMIPYTSGKMVIDHDAPTIHVSNVLANSANNDEVYTFSITVDDADGNLRESDIHPVLTAVVRDENGVHTTQNIELGKAMVTAVGKTYVYTVNDLALDAIYTLSCTATDLAGNSVNVMTLDDAQSYEQVRFSINRNGSTFTYGNEETRELAEQYYVQNVDFDVVIHEINVDPVTTYGVTVNGVELVEGEDYTTSISGGSGEWSLREYVIDSKLFAEEGEYSVVVKSVDATEATAYSDVKHLNMAFVVDRTAPTVVIGGLEDGGRYQSEGQEVTLIPSDEGGMLRSVLVLLYPDGADVETATPTEILFDKSGEELMQYLEENGGVVTFKVPEGYQHTVHIICSDYAQGSDTQANICTNTFTKVTVSSDAMVIFYANKPLFYGAIGGVLVLLLFIFFLIFKRRKREEKKTA